MINEYFHPITAGVASGDYDITIEQVKEAVREELTNANGFESRYIAEKYRKNADDVIVKSFGSYFILTAEEYAIYKKVR